MFIRLFLINDNQNLMLQCIQNITFIMSIIIFSNCCKYRTKPLKLFFHGYINDLFIGRKSSSLSSHNHIIPCDRKYMSIYKTSLRNLYYQHKYNCRVEAVVNQQIQAEQQAAQEYLNMAVVFLHPHISRPGAGGFFMKMYKEELIHMQDFIHYQLLRGGRPLITGLKSPNFNKLNLLEAFKQALNTEKMITELLENIVHVAEAENDYHCADFVTSIFLAEQMRSVNEIAHHVTKLSLFGNNEHAVYHYDVNLVKSYPYSQKNKWTKC